MQIGTLSAQRARGRLRLLEVRQLVLLVWLTVLGLLTRTGAYWDAHWHATVGRDRFWIPPHLLIYSGVAFAGLLGLFVVVRDGVLRKWARPIPWPWLIVMAGAGCLVSAAPFDNLWHLWYGIDVTIWSPPHMIGVLGGWLIDWGLIVGWLVAYRTADTTRLRRWAVFGLLVATTLTISITNFGLIPAVRWSVTQPALPTLYAVFGALLMPLVLIVATEASGRWWLPLAVAAGIALLRLFDEGVQRLGMAVVVPFLNEEVRHNPSGVANVFTTVVLLNIAPAIGVALTALALRQRLGRRWMVVAGLVSGLLIVLAIIELRSGGLVHVNSPVYQLDDSRDFRDEALPFMRIFGQSTTLAWIYASVCGLLSGLCALGLTGLFNRKDAKSAKTKII